MSNVHVYMPVVQLYKLSCCVCQVYIYNFRACSYLCFKCVGVYVASVCISAGCAEVYFVCICEYAKCLCVYIPVCSCINCVTSAKLCVHACVCHVNSNMR